MQAFLWQALSTRESARAHKGVSAVFGVLGSLDHLAKTSTFAEAALYCERC